MSNLTQVITKDGSTTLYNAELDETYHSRHGSIQEALHVFIKTGLENYAKLNHRKKISVFEMGFGTGLNCLLSGIWAEKNHIPVAYSGIENKILDFDQIQLCNYLEHLDNEKGGDIFRDIHAASWNSKVKISPFFSIEKIVSPVETLTTDERFDIVFYDAFEPRAQPHLWEKEILKKMFDLLYQGGILVTYCAKGSVRRTFIDLGFAVERLPGPPGKREMLRATKI